MLYCVSVFSRSHIFLSADTFHSNGMTQHALDIIIKEYAERFAREGRTLRHVHIWSDGCAGQVVSILVFFLCGATQSLIAVSPLLLSSRTSTSFTGCPTANSTTVFASPTTSFRAATGRARRTRRAQWSRLLFATRSFFEEFM